MAVLEVIALDAVFVVLVLAIAARIHHQRRRFVERPDDHQAHVHRVAPPYDWQREEES